MEKGDSDNPLQGPPHEYVVCRECGEKFKTIEWSHLKYKHDMSIDEYEEKYPDAYRVSTSTLMKLGRKSEVMDRLESDGVDQYLNE